MIDGGTGTRWWVIIPVKGAPNGKSRLDGTYPDRSRLARAIATDTIEAVAAAVGTERLIVVTSDAVIAGLATGLGAHVTADPGTGLNPAVCRGVATATTLAPATGGPATKGPDVGALDATVQPGPVAVLLGDLPALRPEELRAALDAAARHTRAFVPDRSGTGTVLLTSLTGDLDPAFGAGSAQAHEDRGHDRLDLDLPSLRTDVDTADDLAAALALGGGRHTAALLADVAPCG